MRSVPRSAACLLLLAGAIASCGSFGAEDDPTPAPGADAAVDGGPAGDGAPGAPFCPKAGTFVCDDFEGATGFRWLGWSKDDEAGRNRIAVDEIMGVPSGTHALHASIASGASGPTDAYVEAKTSVAPKLRLEADVRVASGGANQAILAEIEDDSAAWAVRIRPSGDVEERLLDGDGGVRKRTLGRPGLPAGGTWVHLALAVDIEAHRVTATIGDRTETYPLDPSWAPGLLRARVGLIDASPDVSWDVFVDDVIVAVE